MKDSAAIRQLGLNKHSTLPKYIRNVSAVKEMEMFLKLLLHMEYLECTLSLALQ